MGVTTTVGASKGLIMATTPEGKVKKEVRKVLDSLGAYYVMPVTGGYGKQGAPDFLVCHKGRFIGIETKAGKGKLTTLQEMNLKKIIEAGGLAFVVREDDVKFLPNLLINGEVNE
jgi:G:T-mismatch repair DNA endonuclease (very short patch repair protein)